MAKPRKESLHPNTQVKLCLDCYTSYSNHAPEVWCVSANSYMGPLKTWLKSLRPPASVARLDFLKLASVVSEVPPEVPQEAVNFMQLCLKKARENTVGFGSSVLVQWV